MSNKNPKKNRLKSVAPEGWRVHALEVATTVTLAKSPVRTGKYCDDNKRIHGHLWHWNSKSWWRPERFRSDDFKPTNRTLWFSSFLVNNKPQSRKSSSEQAREYSINFEIYTPRIQVLLECCNIQMESLQYSKSKSYLWSYSFVL